MGVSLPLLGAPGVLGDSNKLNAYLGSLNPTLYLKFNETIGELLNYGAEVITGVVSGCTQGQMGQLGANEAYLYDGVDDVVTLLNASLVLTKALTTRRWCYLVKPTSLGESDIAAFNRWNSGGANRLTFQTFNRLTAFVDTNTTDAVSTTNNDQVDFLNMWALVFFDYDETDILGLGRRIRLLRATAASPTALLTLANNTAATGNLVTPTGNLTIGNGQTTAATFAGYFDFVFAGGGLWSPAGVPTDLTIPNRIRSLVFGV